jgi:hypothetical protein
MSHLCNLYAIDIRTPDLEKRIHEALKAKDRPGVRVIAEQFEVAVNTVQRIKHGPFDAVVV